jgi:hypothetical protein
MLPVEHPLTFSINHGNKAMVVLMVIRHLVLNFVV